MGYAVVAAAANTLIHVPDLLSHGTTISQEKLLSPDSQFLQKWPNHVRSFEQAVGYPPNQTYIGAISPRDLAAIPQPWHENLLSEALPESPHGRIIDELCFYGVLKIADSFELVLLVPEFAQKAKERLAALGEFSADQLKALDKTSPREEVEALVEAHKAEPLSFAGDLVGCVRQAHDTDVNLKASVMLENLVTKASGVLAVKSLLKAERIDPAAIEYMIETSEEAIGDMNQRGGGNLSKAVGEICGLVNATGCDVRAFCAGPSHALLAAASLVRAGTFKKVLVFAGGSVAKLAMNSRDHVNKGLPILEDCLGGYAVLVSEDDGESPVIRNDIVGRHRIASGASPQAVIQAIVCDPLDEQGMKLTDVDLFAPELQNPEITVPAGAGDVPLANYKMIGAMAVKRGEIERGELQEFIDAHGVKGFAPTQGHIPSGIPILPHARKSLMAGEIKRVMIVGKGSLFLGRMTDLFDGVSVLLEAHDMVPPETGGNLAALKEEIISSLAEVLEAAADRLAGR